MARNFPTYSISVERNAKSSGVFITRNIFPKCISKFILSESGGITIYLLEWWDEADSKKKNEAFEHMTKYSIAHKKEILMLFA